MEAEDKKDSKFLAEYYDLPYRYNQTIVKILYQTPKRLFVYWDISDEDRLNLQKQYGEKFFEVTRPVLIVHNITLNYSFEIDINDFANSWYITVNDAKCDYNIELGRRSIPIPQYYYSDNNQENNRRKDDIVLKEVPNYIYISSSNTIETPNNKVLYNPPIYKTVRFQNVKTNSKIEKDISEFPFIKDVLSNDRFYNVYDLYKYLYKDDELRFINNPSSGNPSSMSFLFDEEGIN